MIRWTVGCALLFSIAGAAAAAEDQFLDSGGVKIRYTIEGEGEPVILLHGFAVNQDFQWRLPQILPRLAKHYRVIAVDHRGHGRSDKPHDPLAYGERMVEDVVRLMDHLKIEKAHVVGYSMGAFITAKLITAHPARFQSAVLGGAGVLRPDDKDERLTKDLPEALENGKGFLPLLAALTPEGKPLPTEEGMKNFNRMFTAMNDVKALAAVVRGFSGLAVEVQKLEENQVPTLCLIGAIDPLKKRTVDPIEKSMGNLTIEVIDGGDHINAIAKPAFYEALERFLDAHRMAPSSAPPEEKKPAKAA